MDNYRDDNGYKEVMASQNKFNPHEMTEEEKRRIASVFEPMLIIEKLIWNGDINTVWKVDDGESDEDERYPRFEECHSDPDETGELYSNDSEDVEAISGSVMTPDSCTDVTSDVKNNSTIKLDVANKECKCMIQDTQYMLISH